MGKVKGFVAELNKTGEWAIEQSIGWERKVNSKSVDRKIKRRAIKRSWG